MPVFSEPENKHSDIVVERPHFANCAPMKVL